MNSPPKLTNDDLTLVIGDAHVEPGQSLRRFKWANKYILDVRPQRIVIIGDFATMDSLSEWDRDKRKKMEGRRYQADIDCARLALNLMLDGVDNGVPLVYTEGNHEERTDRYIDYHPELVGKVSVEHDLLGDTRASGRQVIYVPYKQDWNYRGVSFTHVPIQENGKPVGGKTATQRALGLYQNSVVFGHTHKLDVACEHRHNSPHLNQSINVGCYFEHIAEYAIGSVTSYWRGLVLLNHYSTNRVDITTRSLGWLKSVYS